MKIWAVANQKGGVGKTTTTVSIGGLLALRGLRTLMVDLDPHGSLTSYFGYDPESIEPSAYDLFNGKQDRRSVQAMLRDIRQEDMALLPASTALATLDRQLGARTGMGLVLLRALQSVEDLFDVVLLDCPPMLGVLMVNALAACQQLLIPVQTEFLALKGLERMVHTLAMIQRSRASELPYVIVPTMFDRRTKASVNSLREMRDAYPKRVWKGAVPVDTQFRDASKQGVPLPVLHPWARGSQAYRRLLEEVVLSGAPMPQVVG